MTRPASEAFDRWITTSIKPIAAAHGLSGRGPTFRRRDGDNWIVFALERHPLDPHEAQALQDDPHVEFRILVGIVVTALRETWRPAAKAPPGMRDISMYSTDRSLEPADDEDWHVFDASDPTTGERLRTLVERRIGPGIAGLATAPRQILDRRLSVTGPLEQLSPGGAEQLLAMADAAGDTDLRDRIVAAVGRADPRATRRWGDPFRRPAPLRRLTTGMRDRLLRDLASRSVYIRRMAATMLADFPADESAVAGLRTALRDPDANTRSCAAVSLGRLGDADPGTWQLTLAQVDDPDGGPYETGVALVLLAELDPTSRAEAATASLTRLATRHPAWSPDLRSFRDRLQVSLPAPP
jgi:HEAT repeats